MEAIKIPREHRYLLLAGPAPVTRWRLLKVLYLTRWAGQLPEGGVLTPTGLAAARGSVGTRPNFAKAL